MSPLFEIAELVRMGVEDEKTGVAFYSALAGKTQDAGLKKTFASLAEQERHHQKSFEQLLEDLGSYKPQETYPGEYIAYLHAMLESRAFPDEVAARKMAEESDDRRALELAIRFERDTLVLMNELRNMVPEKDRATVDELAREEQAHLVQLTRALETLAA